MHDEALHQGYADFLQSFPWDYYSTVSFRTPRKDAARAAQVVWEGMSALGASRAFLAVETGRATGRIHVHALSRHTSSDLRPTTFRQWRYHFKRHGRSTVEVARDPGVVASYCAKYVTKGAHFSFAGTPEAWNLDK